MATETIELEVDPETARRYREAAPEERQRMTQIAVAGLRGEFGARTTLFQSLPIVEVDTRAIADGPEPGLRDTSVKEHQQAVGRLMDTMDRIGRNAQDRGLTAELLTKVLADGDE
jgi:hypothetical protein